MIMIFQYIFSSHSNGVVTCIFCLTGRWILVKSIEKKMYSSMSSSFSEYKDCLSLSWKFYQVSVIIRKLSFPPQQLGFDHICTFPTYLLFGAYKNMFWGGFALNASDFLLLLFVHLWHSKRIVSVSYLGLGLHR